MTCVPSVTLQQQSGGRGEDGSQTSRTLVMGMRRGLRLSRGSVRVKQASKAEQKAAFLRAGSSRSLAQRVHILLRRRNLNKLRGLEGLGPQTRLTQSAQPVPAPRGAQPGSRSLPVPVAGRPHGSQCHGDLLLKGSGRGGDKGRTQRSSNFRGRKLKAGSGEVTEKNV